MAFVPWPHDTEHAPAEILFEMSSGDSMEKTGVRSAKAGGLLAAALLLVTFVATSAVAQAMQPAPATEVAAVLPAQDSLVAQGEALFDKTCASCHQSGGAGVAGTYPPLLGNPDVADSAYVEDVIRNGRKGELVVDGVTYNSTMSSKGGDLTDSEITAIVEYVVSLSSQTLDQVTVDTTPPPKGDPARGKQLFRGDVKLENGGPGCASCHLAGPVGNLGGYSLGPDLTHVSGRLGGVEGLSGWLVNPPSKTMTPVFSRHPLTTREIADLAAYLDGAPYQQRRTYFTDMLFLGGAVGALILFAGMAIAWRGMRQTYVEKLRSRS